MTDETFKDDPAFAGYNTGRDTHLYFVRHAPVDTGGLMYGGLTNVAVDADMLAAAQEVPWLATTIFARARSPVPIEVYSSPMRRAAQTANAIVETGEDFTSIGGEEPPDDKFAPVILDDRLWEQRFGELEGKPFLEMLEKYGTDPDMPARNGWGVLYERTYTENRRHWAGDMGGAESVYSVATRAHEFLREVVKEGRSPDLRPRHIVIVGHRAHMRLMLADLLFADAVVDEDLEVTGCFGLDNFSLTHVAIRHSEGPHPLVGRKMPLGRIGHITIRALNLTMPVGWQA